MTRGGGTRSAGRAAATTSAASRRLPWLDASRGLALVAMIVYHFCFDLRWFGLTSSDFYRDPFWITCRTLIVAAFLLLVGISLAVARAQGAGRRAFWKRIAKIAGCALTVSAASYLFFPQSFIYFGVLHCIAVASILAQPLTRAPRLALILGAGVVLVGVLFADAFFNPRALSWIGFVTQLPRTEDFVPLFPWLGVVLIGVGAAPLLPVRRATASSPGCCARLLIWMGRRSLWIYMLHQPILIGLLWCVLKIAR